MEKFTINETNGKVKIDWGRQGGIIIFYIFIFISFYGIIANIITIDKYGNWLNRSLIDKTILLWSFEVIIKNFGDYRDYIKIVPFIILFFTCLIMTWKEDIPHYGIKASIWLVPLLISEGFLFYYLIFGFSLEPFYLQFCFINGYLNITILSTIVLSGALSGMFLKKLYVKKQKINEKQ